jgi:glucosamine--fructose-6-phosphate aminotransferase (isomerizing)
MCGIIGIVGKEAVAERLVDGLRRMEYRGYDSAGICTLHDGQLVRRRAEGKLANLVFELERSPAPGDVGIAHTRWATPRRADRQQRAPARDRRGCAGAQRHHRELQAAARGLLARGRTFESETDTEIVAHSFPSWSSRQSPQEAVRSVLPQLRGAVRASDRFPCASRPADRRAARARRWSSGTATARPTSARTRSRSRR